MGETRGSTATTGAADSARALIEVHDLGADAGGIEALGAHGGEIVQQAYVVAVSHHAEALVGCMPLKVGLPNPLGRCAAAAQPRRSGELDPLPGRTHPLLCRPIGEEAAPARPAMGSSREGM
jgi:hypothetical protein